MLDERMIRALHVETMRHEDLHAEREPHVLFQASTIGALLDGAYEGDVTLAELGEHGDLGLGTLDALDGEMIALGGRFYRADVDGDVEEVEPGTRTPFGVVVSFEPTIDFEAGGPMSHDELLADVDRHVPSDTVAFAIRIDGAFDIVKARSVPRQRPPYRPLEEVIGDQHVFEMPDVEGTLVGFRFPDYAQGIEAAGYHLHFITADRSRGGHVLDFDARSARVRVDTSADLHVELPIGVELARPDLSAATHDALERVERSG